MLKFAVFTSLILITGPVVSEARSLRSQKIPECNVSMPCAFSYRQTDRPAVRHARRLLMSQRSFSTDNGFNAVASVNEPEGPVVGGRPAGCPSSYCGCGAALR